jgi:hypothetical protein
MEGGPEPAKKAGPKGSAEKERELLDPEEWKDPEESEILSEFHKEGLPTEELEIIKDPVEVEEPDPDLQTWIEHFKASSSHKVLSEYHKEGAPYLDEKFVEIQLPEEPGKIITARKPGKAQEEEEEEEPVRRRPRLERIIDVHTIELLLYAIARAAFPRKVAFKLQKEGLVDMDVSIEDEDVLFDANRLFFEFPEMAIWKVTFAYQGKPLIDVGRGVKNGMKIHRFNFITALFKIWWHKRAHEKEKEREARMKKRK